MRHLGTIKDRVGTLYNILDAFGSEHATVSLGDYEVGDHVIFRKEPEVEILFESKKNLCERNFSLDVEDHSVGTLYNDFDEKN